MSKQDNINERIDYKLATGQFLESLAIIQSTHSNAQHSEFVANLKETAGVLREMFSEAGLIARAPDTGNEFWSKIAGKRIGFVDGGVASLDIPSAAPVGIRVGTYSVEAGSAKEDREQFGFNSFVVDELYGQNGRTYVESYDDVGKMADAARIISEVSSAVKLANDPKTPDLVMLHGPLINPVAPYGTPGTKSDQGFPAFTVEMAHKLYPFEDIDFQAEELRHFVCLYRVLLEQFDENAPPCVGVIERSATRAPYVISAHLESLHESGRLTIDTRDELFKLFVDYNMTDTMLCSVILDPHEWLVPVILNPQGAENKWPDVWKPEIRRYPKAKTTYIKASDHSDPFRIQISENQIFEEWMGELLVNTALLLPSYNFPVGLDIVDKHAKVPAWMSKSIRGQHGVSLLMKALETNDPKAISFAKRMLAAKGRDWMFRPKA